MPITRATTPTIKIKFSKLEIPDLDKVKAFYFTFTQKGSQISSLAEMIYKNYQTAKGLVIVPNDFDGTSANYNFTFTSDGEKFVKFAVVVADGAVSKITYTRIGGTDTIDVYDVSQENRWLKNAYKNLLIAHDDLSAFNTAISGGLDELVTKTDIDNFDPDRVKSDDTGCWIERTLTQTQTKALIANEDLVGTCDVVYEELVPGSQEHKRGTSKTFADAVCDAERSDEILDGEPS